MGVCRGVLKESSLERALHKIGAIQSNQLTFFQFVQLLELLENEVRRKTVLM